KTITSVRRVQVFPPQREIENFLAVVVMRLFQDMVIRLVLFEIIGISELVQMAADGGLWFRLFGPDNGIKSFFAFAYIGVAPKEIDRAGAEAEQLRHDGVVIVLL